MTALLAQYRLLAIGLAVAVLAGLGATGGAWLAAGHYRPLLDLAQDELAQCRAARGSLQALAGEQGQRLDELALAGEQRKKGAALAVADAQAESAQDYAAANRLQQARIGGDQCAAAITVIDQELGL